MCHNGQMRYETVQALKDEDFKRSTGVQRRTFEKMLEVVTAGLRDFGRPTKLSRADQLLLTLMYWREYRTEFHIGLTYGVSEGIVCRTIKTARKRAAKRPTTWPRHTLPGFGALSRCTFGTLCWAVRLVMDSYLGRRGFLHSVWSIELW